MKKNIEIIGFFITWFAVIAQFILLMWNRGVDLPESIFRFFSYFTILTNILVALYFTTKVFFLRERPFSVFSNKGGITAIAAFILVVGLVYQLILRNLWEPTGLQFIVDELLHTIIPIYFLVVWFYYSNSEDIKVANVFSWLLYPLCYIVFVFLRGYISGFYPYPFFDISKIGIRSTALNIGLILVLIILIMFILIGIGKKTKKLHPKKTAL